MIAEGFKEKQMTERLQELVDMGLTEKKLMLYLKSNSAPSVDDISRFREITEGMLRLYARKNNDYGSAFDISLDEDGLLVSKIRLGDKYRRFSQLINNDALVKDESIRDTLVDMANYAIMTIMWMDGQPSEEPGIVCGLHPSHMQDEVEPSPRSSRDIMDAMTYAYNTREDGE